jgi:hypothetical protein
MCGELTALLSFLDRPFIVAVASGTFLALLARRWQTSQKRNDLQLELLRKFPLFFETKAALLNTWLIQVLWVAEERNKHLANQTQDSITRLEAKIVDFQKEFYKAEPLDGVLIPMEACFPSMANKAKEFMSKWSEFEKLMNATNQEYNVSQSLSVEKIRSAGESRRTILQELENRKRALLQALAKNL